MKKLNVMEVPKSPVIFALTHIGKWDFEIISEQIKEQSFVIASDFIHMHEALSFSGYIPKCLYREAYRQILSKNN